MAFPSPLYVSATTYVTGDKVNFRGLDYRSLQNANVAHQPDTNPTWWTLDTTWLAGTTYAVGATVTYNGWGYLSLVGSNTNHIPNAAPVLNTPTWWTRQVVRSAQINPPSSAFALVPSWNTTNPAAAGVGIQKQVVVTPHMSHIGSIVGNLRYSTPANSPGPSSVWIGRVVFRVPKLGWFYGLGQRANKTPVSHNSGE